MKKNRKLQVDIDHISKRLVNFDGIDFLWWVTLDKKAFKYPLAELIKDHSKFLSNTLGRKLVIQAGGNCGLYARFYGNYFEKVYTFEPQSNNYNCLSLNCQGEKYVLFKQGLGKEITKADLFHPSDKRSNMGIWKIKDNVNGNIEIVTIDSLDLEYCNLIHLDIEGYEENALIGGEKTINKFKPTIILEEGHGAEIVKSFGYSLVERCSTDWIYRYV